MSEQRVMLSVDEARAVGAVIAGLRDDVGRLIEAGYGLLTGHESLDAAYAWDAAVKAARDG